MKFPFTATRYLALSLSLYMRPEQIDGFCGFLRRRNSREHNITIFFEILQSSRVRGLKLGWCEGNHWNLIFSINHRDMLQYIGVGICNACPVSLFALVRGEHDDGEIRSRTHGEREARTGRLLEKLAFRWRQKKDLHLSRNTSRKRWTCEILIPIQKCSVFHIGCGGIAMKSHRWNTCKHWWKIA